MEDFLLLILFFIIYLIAGSSGKKKNKKNKGNSQSARRSGPMRTRHQGEQYDVRTQEKDRLAQEGFRAAFSQESAHQDLSCDRSRLHLHEVTNDQMLEAAEGEDPCHAGDAQTEMDGRYEPLLREEQAHDTLKQDVLRGVVMSEILIRPNERRALQRSRQRTNGY